MENFQIIFHNGSKKDILFVEFKVLIVEILIILLNLVIVMWEFINVPESVIIFILIWDVDIQLRDLSVKFVRNLLEVHITWMDLKEVQRD